MSLVRTFSLDEMQFGKYYTVPVNSTSLINKKADFSSGSAPNRQPVVQIMIGFFDVYFPLSRLVRNIIAKAMKRVAAVQYQASAVLLWSTAK